MQNFTEKRIDCPHCGHTFRMTLDVSGGDQEFYDDCPVCCNAIHLSLKVDNQHKTISLYVDADDEQVF
ncbi:molybdopterin-guanine dinucleotide biosynthesis protein A [Veronia nyctiphanis]|uniref:Molybdopterin-guanine dinucleotide biosynthesis protein A n=1 Tax=Veronia nyctiphanis TaxID=1278244 RepID=A0A4Q0YLV2_9GAMM|nr:CPXCG motif-containing cysteine-rich protein [Veronia nyctiphanis]RXJ71666.1 molybdopterin-guanine dinucleotide biosynthesis protein A [Veronia nyctiphanis]